MTVAAKVTRESRLPDVGLSPYVQCPGRSASCRFAEAPTLKISTGHDLSPTVEIFRCAACGHGVTRPAMPDVTPLYAGRESDDYLARDSGWIRQLKLIRFRALAKTLLKYLPDHGTAKIADFGTGNGMLVACMKSVRPGTKVIGLDFFDEPPAEIGQADYCGFADAGEFKGTIDLLTCFHALEHDDDPHAFLEGLLSYLKPGGVLVLEVPNVDCVWTPWFGDACANWYAPYHRLHFSRQSLADLFENHGLTVMAEEDVCGPTIALSLANLVGVKPSAWIFAAGVAARPIQWLAEKMTGRPSALRMIAQKR